MGEFIASKVGWGGSDNLFSDLDRHGLFFLEMDAIRKAGTSRGHINMQGYRLKGWINVI
jgi:hypothetical protein